MKKSKKTQTPSFSMPFVVAIVIIVLGFVALYFVAITKAKNDEAVVDGATIQRDDNCGVFDGNGNRVQTGFQELVSKGENGNIMLRCEGDNIVNNSGQVQVFDFERTGKKCSFLNSTANSLDIYATTNWREVLTPNGHASYICHFTEEDIATTIPR